MSITASINVTLYKTNYDTSIISIIDYLCKNEWKIYINGKVTYLPFGDYGDYNWVSENITQEKLFQILTKKQQNNEVIGIELYLKNSNIGGELLVFNNNELSLNISINQRFINNNNNLKILDINWYIEKFISCLAVNFMIEHFSYEQFGCK